MQLKNSAVPLRSDIIGGITTFLTMSYIIVVNPHMLATPGTGMSFSGVLTATVLLCALMTLAMGIYARLPYGVAPGMGINAFFTYTVVLSQGVPWPTALGAVFWAGVLFIIASLTPFRAALALAIPKELRHAAAAGIGLLLAFIGLKNAGIVVADPVTFVKLGVLDLKVLLVILGIFVSAFLLRRKSSLAFLASLSGLTILGWCFGMVKAPVTLLSQPDFTSMFLQLDIWSALQLSLLPTIISIMMTDFFDSLATFVGVAHATDLLDEDGEPLRLKQGLLVDAFATMTAGLLGTSAGTAYIESAAGIEAGGRSGRAAVVTALCFLPCLFIAPIVQMIPAFATAPVLILIGVLMFRTVITFEFSSLEKLLPAFLTMILIPLTFSITQGLLWGFISYVLMHVLVGKAREVKPILYAIALISVGLICLENT